MKKIIALSLLVFWNAGMCFSPSEIINSIFTDDYEDWSAVVEFAYSVDGESWTDFRDAAEFSASEIVYLKVVTQVVTDYTFSESKDLVPVTLKISTDNGCDGVLIHKGNGSFAWDNEGVSGEYNFHVVGQKEGVSRQNITILAFRNVRPGVLSVEAEFGYEILQNMYGAHSNVIIRPNEP